MVFLGMGAEEASAMASMVGFGSAAGYLAGFALRQAGKIAATAVGTGFIIVQGLAFMGYVDVNWKKVETDYTSYLDINKDGQVDLDDVRLLYEKMERVVSFNLPAGASFTAGMLYGMGTTSTTAVGTTAVAGVVGRVLASRAVAASAVGGAAVGGPAVLVGIRDYLGLGGDKGPELTEMDQFVIQMASEDLDRLREAERALAGELRALARGSPERAELEQKLALVEELKGARKGRR